MSSEIPAEFLRQLVLLMWDYASMNTSDGEGECLQWGIDRVYFLVLAIKNSNRSNAAGVGDTVVSLLSLLAFQTATPLKGPNSPRLSEVLEILSGSALKYLVLPPVSSLKGEGYAVVKSPGTVLSDSTDIYFNVVNVLSQDNSKRNINHLREETQFLNMNESDWNPVTDKKDSFSNLPLLMHESWEQLARTGFEAMSLPVSLGKRFILSMSLKSMINSVLMSCKGDLIPPDNASQDGMKIPLIPLETARWALTMESAYLRPANDSINFSSGSEFVQLSKIFTNRILSSVDGLPFNTYTVPYCDFQLNFSLTLLTLASVLDSCLSMKATVKCDINLCLKSVLCSLLQVPMIDNDTIETSTHIFQCLCKNSNCSDKNTSIPPVNGSLFWGYVMNRTTEGHQVPSVRSQVQAICSLTLELCSGIVSQLDRNISTNITSDESLDKPYGNELVKSSRNLMRLCEVLNSFFPLMFNQSTSSIESTIESAVIQPSDYFEAMPGKIINFSKVKRPTVLFDRFSTVWRAGSVGSSERVLASMKNAQSSSFSDMSTSLKINDIDNQDVEGDTGIVDDGNGAMDVDEMEGI